TGVPCMFLENCNYGRDEMAVLNMVRQGIFGELIHCQGGDQHDLRDVLIEGFESNQYRIQHYINRDGDNYPTHGLGPLAKCLNINRGNQLDRKSTRLNSSHVSISYAVFCLKKKKEKRKTRKYAASVDLQIRRAA